MMNEYRCMNDKDSRRSSNSERKRASMCLVYQAFKVRVYSMVEMEPKPNVLEVLLNGKEGRTKDTAIHVGN